jgi:UDP:flavonoid glycosyltransferase YjiC (YdhE family)
VSRFLFVVPPLAGHVNPTVAVGAELTARGHEVAWAGHLGTLRPLLPPGARVFPVVLDPLEARLRANGVGLSGFAALRFLWEEFIMPLAREMLPGVQAAIATFTPDVVVADQQALAGAVAARRAGVTWVTSATTPAELMNPLAHVPKVETWISDQMTVFQLGAGLSDPVDPRFSDQLVLVFTTSALMGDTSGFAKNLVFTGPALAGRADRGSFPWGWLDPARRHLLVSLGTISGPAGMRFFRVAVEALADLGDELQVVMVAPALDQVPRHILVTGHVPQLALLPHMAAVVSHGGHNTVCESLAHGLPLVVTPIRDDQSIIAQQVADAGAGIRLRFARLTAGELRPAIRAVLDDPSYRQGACRVRDSFTAAGGARAAADHLEKIL